MTARPPQSTAARRVRHHLSALVGVLMLALLGTSLTTAPAQASGGWSRTGTDNIQIDPTGKDEGTIYVFYNFTASDNANGCYFSYKVKWEPVNANGTSKSVFADQLNEIVNRIDWKGDKPTFKALFNGSGATIGGEESGNFTAAQQCVYVVNRPYGSNSGFWGSTFGKVLRGTLANTAFNVTGIGGTLFVAAFLAHKYPKILAATLGQQAITALAYGSANFFSAMVLGSTWAAAGSAAGVSTCFTFFTEAPYVDAFNAYIRKAKATVAAAGTQHQGTSGMSLTQFTQLIQDTAGSTIGAVTAWASGHTASIARRLSEGMSFGNIGGLTLNVMAVGIDQGAVTAHDTSESHC